MEVYVKAQSGKWLMPTRPAKARLLLKRGKARVINKMPFSIQLTYPTPEAVQDVTVGIDDGGIYVGIAAVSNGRTIYQQELTLRTDIKGKTDTKRQLRRGRRTRNKRYRKPRFLNRKAARPVCKVCGGNAPTSKVICRKCMTGHNRNQAEIEKTHANDAVIIADKHAQPSSFQFMSQHVQSRKRSLHEATARKGRKQPNKTQKRNNKNVFTLKGFRRHDTVKYRGQVGFITGFTGTGSAYIIDIHGKYIKNPTKTYNMVNLSDLKWVSPNQTVITSPIHPLPN